MRCAISSYALDAQRPLPPPRSASAAWASRLAPMPTLRDRCLALHPHVKLAHQVVVVELVGRAALERDLAVHDDIAAIGDADGLREILLRHQHGQLIVILQL